MRSRSNKIENLIGPPEDRDTEPLRINLWHQTLFSVSNKPQSNEFPIPLMDNLLLQAFSMDSNKNPITSKLIVDDLHKHGERSI